jgi:hypothetical protein
MSELHQGIERSQEFVYLVNFPVTINLHIPRVFTVPIFLLFLPVIMRLYLNNSIHIKA